MPSKGFQRFNNRLVKFREDGELAEILLLNKELIKGTDSIFKGVNEDNHPLMSNRQNSAGSRGLVAKHLISTIYVAIIKELYEEVTEYLRYILKQGALNGADTQHLIGENSTINLKANDILALPTKKDITGLIMDNVFRSLERERSTIKLISRINDRLGLNVSEEVIREALPYLDARHIFVHSDGKPDEEFMEKYPDIELDRKGKIELNATFISNAYNSVCDMLHRFDDAMIDRNYISASEMQP